MRTAVANRARIRRTIILSDGAIQSSIPLADVPNIEYVRVGTETQTSPEYLEQFQQASNGDTRAIAARRSSCGTAPWATAPASRLGRSRAGESPTGSGSLRP
ncbi:MAG: hypothetical protein HC888_12670, partial [Candidatus Competibacteraceae bacterium]|nr:hypothetical protein [Candidatus Competibacteraceae bacterium]